LRQATDLNASDLFFRGRCRFTFLEVARPFRSRQLFRCGGGKGKDHLRHAVLVGGVGVGDVRLGFLQFGLGEFLM